MFLTGLLWLPAASIASRTLAGSLVVRFGIPLWEPLLRSAFFAVLILGGFAVLRWMMTREKGIASANELPSRSTSRQEWLVGAAFGWGLALAVTLLLLLSRSLETNFWITPRSIGMTLLSLITLLVATLSWEAAYRGWLYRQLIDAAGPVGATIVLSLFYALAMTFGAPSAGLGAFLTSFALGLVLALAYQRTRAIWLPWGLHFAWASTIAVLFGMPLAGDGTFSAFVTTDLSGHVAIAGGGFGPEGSLLTLLLAILSLPVLYRVTRDFDWEYNAPVMVPGGYAMEAQPPAAHVAMEQQARPAPVPLVQILAATPTEASTMRAVNDHLREGGETN